MAKARIAKSGVESSTITKTGIHPHAPIAEAICICEVIIAHVIISHTHVGVSTRSKEVSILVPNSLIVPMLEGAIVPVVMGELMIFAIMEEPAIPVIMIKTVIPIVIMIIPIMITIIPIMIMEAIVPMIKKAVIIEDKPESEWEKVEPAPKARRIPPPPWRRLNPSRAPVISIIIIGRITSVTIIAGLHAVTRIVVRRSRISGIIRILRVL